jgi:hypothetical protein
MFGFPDAGQQPNWLFTFGLLGLQTAKNLETGYQGDRKLPMVGQIGASPIWCRRG